MTRTTPDNTRLLIVEDHETMRAMLRTHVQSAHPAWIVFEAADGAGALVACRRHHPHLILMDIGLPDIDGITLTDRVKALVPDAAVVIVSHQHARIYVERTREMGAFAFVTKDRIFQDLLTTMAQALDFVSSARSATT